MTEVAGETTADAQSGAASVPVDTRSTVLALLGYAALSIALFGDTWLASEPRVPTHPLGDIINYYVHSRSFGFEELAQGNLPLWNPHTFSGTPFVGVFQSSIFYPPNLFYFVLPVAAGLTLEIVVTLTLLGGFTFLWARGKGLDPVAAFVSGSVTMLAATSSLRVMAGALSVLETYAWWPLLLLSIDRLAVQRDLRFSLVGITAISMMILAGHPPTVLMAAFATSLYVLPLLAAHPTRLRFVGRLAVVAAAPLALTAVQLWPGLHTATEGVRSTGVTFDFATSFSFPPEQLLTLVAPDAFGNASLWAESAFGRVFYWDANAFMGIAALMLAVHGALHAHGRHRDVALVLCLALSLLAFGRYTPAYGILFETMPGFSFIRAPSKFMFFAIAFASLLAGFGVDRLLSNPRGARRTAAIAGALGLLLAALALATWRTPVDPPSTTSLLAKLAALEGAQPLTLANAALRRDFLLTSTAIGAATAALTALFFALATTRRRVLLLSAFAILELGVFVSQTRATAKASLWIDRRQTLVETYRQIAPNRVLESAWSSNIAYGVRGYGLWGYDPVVLDRYAKFMGATQGVDIDRFRDPTLLRPMRYHPRLAMLRMQAKWRRGGQIEWVGDPLPRFLLVRDHQVVDDADAALRATLSIKFDARRSVVLEEDPDPYRRAATPPAASDTLRVLSESTDHIDFEIDVAAPTVLVITDAYSSGWRANALDGSAQREYELLPANYTLRGVPLAPGRHRLRVEYAPLAYRAGAVTSALSSIAFLGAVAWAFRDRAQYPDPT